MIFGSFICIQLNNNVSLITLDDGNLIFPTNERMW